MDISTGRWPDTGRWRQKKEQHMTETLNYRQMGTQARG